MKCLWIVEILSQNIEQLSKMQKSDGNNVHVSKMLTHYSMETSLRCIPIQSTKDTAFVVPDNELDAKHDNTTSFHNDVSKFDMLEKGIFVAFKKPNQLTNIFLEFDKGSLGT